MMGMLRDGVRRLVPEETREDLKKMLRDGKRRIEATRGFLNRPDLYDGSTPERSGVIFLADSHQTTAERFMLYGLVRGLRPQRVLEIGTQHGGSASIIAAALEDNGSGRIIGLDPAPDLTTPVKRFYDRFTLIEKKSPDAIPEARELAGGPFDFVHFDSIVTYRQLKGDLEGVLPHVAERACFLLNNPFHFGTDQAIAEFVNKNANVFDGGQVATAIDTENEPRMAYAGLRLLRVRPKVTDECQPYIEEAFKASNKPVPHYRADLINHDPWFCRFFEKCEACQKQDDS